MLLMGDECGRTQQGNNNAYCHDGPLTWFDWSLLEKNADLFRFCRLMIAFRARHPMMRHPCIPVGRVRRATRLRWCGTARARAAQIGRPAAECWRWSAVAPTITARRMWCIVP